MQQALVNVSVATLQELSDQFIDYGYSVRGHSKWTMRTRQSHLKAFVTYCTLQGITDINHVNHYVIDQFFVEYTKTRSQNTANTARRVLKVFFQWIDGYKETPTKIHPPSIYLVRVKDATPKSLKREQICAAITHATHPQDKLMIAVMFEAGLRISELVNLKVSDIQRGILHIEGKGMMERTVYITDRLSMTLSEFIRVNSRLDHERVFQSVYNGYGNSLSITTARRRIQQCFKRTGVTMYPHQLRHSFAITLLEHGCDLVTIQRLLGHSDISITMNYLRVKDKHVENSYAAHIGSSVMQ